MFGNSISDDSIESFLDWLRSDLNNTSKLWKIVYQNRPLYCSHSGQECNSDAKILREFLEDIYVTYGVDLVLTGQLRSYERNAAISKGQIHKESRGYEYINVNYPAYINCGLGGSQEPIKVCK